MATTWPHSMQVRVWEAWLGCKPEGHPSSPFYLQLDVLFKVLWADHGDHLATQYAGEAWLQVIPVISHIAVMVMALMMGILCDVAVEAGEIWSQLIPVISHEHPV